MLPATIVQWGWCYLAVAFRPNREALDNDAPGFAGAKERGEEISALDPSIVSGLTRPPRVHAQRRRVGPSCVREDPKWPS